MAAGTKYRKTQRALAAATRTAPATPQDEFARFREAKDFMNATIVDALAKAEGDDHVNVMVARLREMLG
jgi:hypothetical protein